MPNVPVSQIWPDGQLNHPGTQPGKILKLRGKGIPEVNGYGTGDYLVYVQVYIPKRLDRKEKEIVESWRNSSSFTPKG